MCSTMWSSNHFTGSLAMSFYMVTYFQLILRYHETELESVFSRDWVYLFLLSLIAKLNGCFPPSLTFILSTFRASSGPFMCEGAWSKMKMPWAMGYFASNMSTVSVTYANSMSLLKYPSVWVSNNSLAFFPSCSNNPPTSSTKSDTMIAWPKDFCFSTGLLPSVQ